MKNTRTLIKLGGAALNDPNTRQVVTETIHAMQRMNQEVILVHGGGPTINAELRLRGIEWTFSNGQRVTSPAMMDVIEYALCGIVNRQLVRHFCANGIKAVGLSGSDRQTLLCTKASEELGQVGNIIAADAKWIEEILSLKSLPVIAPIGVGSGGEAYNINADWAACHLAAVLSVDQLLFLTDQPGILDQQGQVIANVNACELHAMIDKQVVTGGMLTKTKAILHALENGVQTVRVTNAVGALSSTGTQCTLKSVMSKTRLQTESDHVLA